MTVSRPVLPPGGQPVRPAVGARPAPRRHRHLPARPAGKALPFTALPTALHCRPPRFDSAALSPPPAPAPPCPRLSLPLPPSLCLLLLPSATAPAASSCRVVLPTAILCTQLTACVSTDLQPRTPRRARGGELSPEVKEKLQSLDQVNWPETPRHSGPLRHLNMKWPYSPRISFAADGDGRVHHTPPDRLRPARTAAAGESSAILLPPPSTFGSCFNSDGGRASAK